MGESNGESIKLKASDGHQFGAYRATPQGKIIGSVVVVQEIFGVNVHIRDVCDRFAAEGFYAIAPGVFDRIEPGIELGYDEADIKRGFDLRNQVGPDRALLDIDAAIAEAREHGTVGVVGFCWGGSLTWLAATRLSPASAVCYYGAQIIDFVNEQPRCPVLMHFGTKDASIPAEARDRIHAAHPGVEIHTYPADHGFNCDRRGAYDAPSAALAWKRTIAFFRDHLEKF